MADRIAGGAHRAPRGARTSDRGGVRRFVYGSTALLIAGLLVMGGQGTLAYWNDSATVGGTTFNSGKLDLTVDGAQGIPSYAKTDLTMSSMLPGESAASTIAVRNVGDAGFTWTATSSKGGDLGPALVVEMYVGGTASPDDTSYPRTETCTGTLVGPGSTPSRLEVGGAQNLCVKVSLPAATGDAFQNKTSGSVTITLAATQVIS